MADQGVSMPGVFGGLMRYNEEYKSKFTFKPAHVIAIIVLFALGIMALNMFL